jgi:amidohydrolase
MELHHRIKQLAEQKFEPIRDIRRHLHRHPELSFKEFRTSEYVRSRLDEMGIPYKAGYAGTGLVARIEGRNPESRTVALRADMDALPILEKTGAGYQSQNPGVMHACGHDVHTACLLGAADILHQLRSEWEGTVVAVFQPGEELNPGGASLMLKEGALEQPKPGAIWGQHVFPELEVGKVGFRPGLMMAAADEVHITVKGRGGHGALPHKVIDPVVVASHVVIALQQLVSRQAHPLKPTVLSIGKMIADGANNVIPFEVKMEGTLRTFDEEWRFEAHKIIERIAKHTALAFGAEADVHIDVGYPCLYNDEALTLRSIEKAREFLGADNVVDLEMRMTAEDFSFYTHHMPGCFFRLGTADSDGKGNAFPVHHNQFDINERAMITGMGLMAWMAVS